MTSNQSSATERIRPVATFPDLTIARVSVTQGESLPRWEAAGAVYDISLHLADSVPSEQLLVWRKKREQFRRAFEASEASESARKALLVEIHEIFNDRIEKYLTSGYGSCLLRRADVATATAEVFKHDNGRHYALHAYTIMPNHVHLIAGGFDRKDTLKKTIDQWKRISAHEINRMYGRTGDVWQRDAYTRIIRDRAEYAAKLSYVWHNPEAAGLTTGFLRERFV